ncbi:MAG: hypothetical protein AB2693_27160, partial [Candidatus Thiodiazotropha sp.]
VIGECACMLSDYCGKKLLNILVSKNRKEFTGTAQPASDSCQGLGVAKAFDPRSNRMGNV